VTMRSPGATQGQPTRRHSRLFLATGIAAILFTALAAPLGLLDWLPVVGELRRRGGGVGVIAVLVVATALWIIFFTLARIAVGSQERRAVRYVRGVLAASPPGRYNGAVIQRVRGAAPHNSLLAQRIEALAAGGGRDSTMVTLATRSELDNALSDVSYLPARALVWALPALGFLGTAAEMSRAVGGLGSSVGATSEYTELRNALVSQVIPPLADAFGVTLFALGAGVVCHLLLTWINSADQRILLNVEEVTLELFADLPPTPSPAAAPTTLNGEIGELINQLGMARSAMKESASQVATLDLSELSHLQQLSTLAPLLQSVDQRLGQIHTELARDLVITRSGSQVPRSYQ
jgi:hypothetical protein